MDQTLFLTPIVLSVVAPAATPIHLQATAVDQAAVPGTKPP
jgi:hypothetical protein